MKYSAMNYRAEWYNLVDRYEEALRNNSAHRWPGLNRRQAELEALGSYKLLCLAERIGKSPLAPWGHLTIEQALNLYLINKHHWTPSAVKDLKEEDYLYLLRDDLERMKLSAAEAEPVKGSFEDSPRALKDVSVHWD